VQLCICCGIYIEKNIHVKGFVLCFDKVLDQGKILDLNLGRLIYYDAKSEI